MQKKEKIMEILSQWDYPEKNDTYHPIKMTESKDCIQIILETSPQEALRGINYLSDLQHSIENKIECKVKIILSHHIKKIKVIAVASGKGGVGKSTIAAHLAFALQEKGHKVGLLDGDIYGPSVPTLMGVQGPLEMNEEGKFIPLKGHGISCQSVGFLTPPKQPIIWRGPMAQKMLLDLYEKTTWEECDILVVDLPPGTGDIQLTLVQKIPLWGVVIVSTPQDLAFIDGEKATAMFQKMEIPILGLVENMSHFECPSCHHKTPIFDTDLRQKALDLSIPFLGSLPLDIDVRKAIDQGIPLPIDHPWKQSFSPIASAIHDQLFK
jgi:ATP-binding protein involved in chromosome partitioning